MEKKDEYKELILRSDILVIIETGCTKDEPIIPNNNYKLINNNPAESENK